VKRPPKKSRVKADVVSAIEKAAANKLALATPRRKTLTAAQKRIK